MSRLCWTYGGFEGRRRKDAHAAENADTFRGCHVQTPWHDCHSQLGSRYSVSKYREGYRCSSYGAEMPAGLFESSISCSAAPDRLRPLPAGFGAVRTAAKRAGTNDIEHRLDHGAGCALLPMDFLSARYLWAELAGARLGKGLVQGRGRRTRSWIRRTADYGPHIPLYGIAVSIGLGPVGLSAVQGFFRRAGRRRTPRRRRASMSRMRPILSSAFAPLDGQESVTVGIFFGWPATTTVVLRLCAGNTNISK